MRTKYTYLLTFLKNPSTKNALIASILSFCILLLVWSPYFGLAIYPDEVAYQLITGRWFQEGFRPSVLNKLCHPDGVLIPAVFWPATILTSVFHALIYGLKAERIYPMLLMGGVFAGTIGCLTQKISLKYLAFLPVAIAAFGVMPLQIQLLRPEFVWIILALILFICALQRGLKSSINLANLSVFLFYIGSYLHPEFIFLTPAVIFNFAQQKIRLYIKLLVITLILFFAISSLGYVRELSNCSEFPMYQSAMNRISAPTFSWSFAKDAIVNVIFPMDTIKALPHLKMIYALPDLKVSQGFQLANISYAIGIFGLFVLGLLMSSFMVLKSSLRQARFLYERKSKSKILQYQSHETPIYSYEEDENIGVNRAYSILNTQVDINLIYLIYLGGFLLYFLDPNHVFYRNLAFFITSSFCLVVYIDILISKLKIKSLHHYRVSVGILIIPVMMAILSTVYSFGYVLPEITDNGYSGPSVPLKAWHSSLNIKTSNLIYETLLRANPSREKIIVDDYSYRLVRSRYKEIFPISYLGMFTGTIASENVVSFKLNGTPVILTCNFSSRLPIRLLSAPLEVPDYHNICIGIVDIAILK
jgi:hypothetical protein